MMRGLVKLAARSAWARRLTLGLMVGAIAVSTLIMLATERLRHDVRNSFSQALSGTDLVVGARASATQLVLHAVFQIGPPTQPVSLARVEAIRRLPQVSWVVPLALGDSVAGHPVIATDPAFFTHVRVGDQRALEIRQGRVFGSELEAVLGADAARRLRVQPGDKLTLSHGAGALAEASHDDQPFTVVGVLAASGSPFDRSVLVSLESWQSLHAGWAAGVRPRPGFSASGASPALVASQRPASVSAALVGLHNRAAVFSVQRLLQGAGEEPLTAALPGVTLDELWRGLGLGEAALRLLTALVALASLAGLVSVVLASLESRRRELAILRSVGASPVALASLMMIETLLAALVGVAIALALGVGLLAMLGPWIQADFGIALATDWPRSGEWLLIGAVLLASMLAGLLPAWRAWRLSLADGLAPQL